MMPLPVVLATEDALSEAVGLRLLNEYAMLVSTPPMALRRGGFGYLRSRMDSWRQMAQRQIVILLTDLDRIACSVILLEDWLGKDRIFTENLILRIAEREVESWLLADHEALIRLMGKRIKLSRNPDVLPDPKQFLLEQARKAPRSIREDLVAETEAMTRQGLGYNARLAAWVRSEWCPERAAARSPSLVRALRALSNAASLLTHRSAE